MVQFELGGRIWRNAWLLLPAALCTLATHAVAYRSLLPAGPAHGYFGWYEPLVGALSLASLIAFAALLLLAAGARESSTLAAPLRRLSARLRAQGSRDLWARLAGLSLSLFVLQESVERSIQLGSPTVTSLSAPTWLLALLAIGAFAGLLALVARSSLELVELVLGRGVAGRLRRVPASVRPLRPFARPRRCSPLAERRGLRAPPLLAS